MLMKASLLRLIFKAKLIFLFLSFFFSFFLNAQSSNASWSVNGECDFELTQLVGEVEISVELLDLRLQFDKWVCGSRIFKKDFIKTMEQYGDIYTAYFVKHSEENIFVNAENGQLTWHVSDLHSVEKFNIYNAENNELVATLLPDESSFYSLFLGIGNYFLEVVRKDHSKESFIPITNISLQLGKGWNLIGIALEKNNFSELFEENSNTSWFYYDYDLYVTDLLSFQDVDLRGFWIFLDEDKVINVFGHYLSESTINLTCGWNLFSPSSNNISAAIENCEAIYCWNAQLQVYEEVSTGETLQLGRGYWIFSLQEQTVEF